MPVAFLFNRRLEGADDQCLAHALSGFNYAMVSQCYQLHLDTPDNSVGIVAAEVQANFDTADSSFPQRIPSINAVLTVVHEARLPELEGMTNVLSIPWGNAKGMVLDSLLQCAKVHSTAWGRSSKKHAGQAQNILRREISALSSASSGQQPEGLFVEPPLQQVPEFLDMLPASELWPDVALWLTSNSFERKHLLNLAPGWSGSLEHLLPVLRCELKAYALKRMKASRIQYVKSGKLLSLSADGTSSPVILSVDRAGLPDKANPKHCVTLVCVLEDLHSQVFRVDNFNLASVCSTHLVCGMSPDMRRLRLQPPVLHDANTYILVIFLERVHDVVFAYDCLRVNNIVLPECQEEDYQALRAWCGVSSVEHDSVLHAFGKPGCRAVEICQAEEHLKVVFSDPQRHVLNSLDGALSVIACVAGAGKTKVLQAILLWAYQYIVKLDHRDICITYCASTQELVKETMDEFRSALPPSHRINVAWGFGFDRARFVDRLQEQIQLAIADKTPVVAIADALTDSTTFFWGMYKKAYGLLSDPASRKSLFLSCRSLCLWLLSVQHAFLDQKYYRVVHADCLLYTSPSPRD